MFWGFVSQRPNVLKAEWEYFWIWLFCQQQPCVLLEKRKSVHSYFMHLHFLAKCFHPFLFTSLQQSPLNFALICCFLLSFFRSTHNFARWTYRNVFWQRTSGRLIKRRCLKQFLSEVSENQIRNCCVPSLTAASLLIPVILDSHPVFRVDKISGCYLILL